MIRSPFLRSSYARQIHYHLKESCRSYSFKRHISTYSQESNKLFNRLLAFHKANIEVVQNESNSSVREAEEQAKREWKWMEDSIYQRRKGVDSISENQKLTILSGMVNRLTNHEPLAYVLGDQPFGPLTILCKSPILIPRSETEFLTEYIFQKIKSQIIKHMSDKDSHRSTKRPLRILDLCTGSGCIALLLRHRILECLNTNNVKGIQNQNLFEISGVDISQSALQLANENLEFYNKDEENKTLLKKFDKQVSINFHKLDMLNDECTHTFVQSNGPFDVIVCNPPYIPFREWQELDKSVREWEDIGALIGHKENEKDGLLFYRKLARLIQSDIITGKDSIESGFPFLAVELGHNQADKVKEIFVQQAGMTEPEIWTDPYNVKRAVIGQIPLKTSC